MRDFEQKKKTITAITDSFLKHEEYRATTRGKF